MDNLLEVIAYILKEIDGNGNPDSVQREYGIDSEKYIEILNVMVDDKYIISHKIDMLGTPLPEESTITGKGYNLMRKF